MDVKHIKSKDEPKGGWLGPPNSTGLAAIAVATKAKRGKWVWQKQKLTAKELKAHKKFQKQMKKADKKGVWRF